MTANGVDGLAERQRAFFRTGATLEPAFRLDRLARLRSAIVTNEERILAALQRDLGRPAAEAFIGEVAFLLQEIDRVRWRLGRWARPRRVASPLILFPSASQIVAEPYGSVLIIAPWNYPVQLSISPLISAVAAGNCAVIKPSEMAPHASQIVAELIAGAFDPDHVAVVQGDADAARALLVQPFDFFFFTGSRQVGQTVLRAAAEHMVPAVLELGGKNPCLVAADAAMATAARRIAWGKFVNAGQTCIAPDFIVVEKAAKDRLVAALADTLTAFYGPDARTSSVYGRIVDDRHFARLDALITDRPAVIGGGRDAADRYIAPTVIEVTDWNDPLMQEEIFGPVLPVLAVDRLETAIELLARRPKPLALYAFGGDTRRLQRIVRGLPSGGAGINDVLGQWFNLRLPFGGIGESGIGSYRGKAGFETFSHMRGVVSHSTLLEVRLRYPPYRVPLWLLRRVWPWML